MDTARAPLGKVQSSRLKSATYMSFVPNAAAGEYVIIQLHKTNFDRESGMMITIAPSRD